jgi:hypothetical protein
MSLELLQEELELGKAKVADLENELKQSKFELRKKANDSLLLNTSVEEQEDQKGWKD